MSIRNSLLVLLLLTSTVVAQPVITVDNFTIDSSTTQDFANITIGHPRFQIAPFSDSGDVAFYMSAYPGGAKIWRYSKNLDSSVQFVQTYVGITNDALNHAHVTTKNDFTGAFIGTTNSSTYCDLYTLSGGIMARTQRFAWPAYSDAQWFVAAPIQIGSSDTVIAIGRGGDPEHPKYAISTDGGATFGDTIRIPSNASPFPNPTDITNSEGRIGGIRYNGTAAAIFRYQRDAIDSASMIWWEWDRTNKEWDEMGHPIDRSFAGYGATTFYRSFAANALGTTRFVVHCINNVGGVDSVLWAHRALAAGDWTRGGFQTSTVQATATNYPFVALTYIERSNRLVLFYTQDLSTNNNDRVLYMRYWDATAGDWSTPTLISRYPRCINVTTAQIVPSSHGDVCYAMFSGSANGRYYAEGAKVTFTEQTTINITSLPYTISTSSRTYTINGAKLSSATNGITIAANVHDIIIDGQGDTIVFGTGGTTVGSNYTLVDPDDGDRGIIIGAGVYNATIRNLVVKHDPPANIRTDSTLISNACAVRWAAGGRTHDIVIEGCHFSIAPVRNAWIMYINNSSSAVGGAHYNNLVRNCTWADSCNAWARRDYWIEQAGIVLELFNYGISAVAVASRPNFQYHMKFEACSTITAFWANLYIEGDSSIVVVENNAFKTDGWNRLSGTAYDAQMQAARGGFDAVNCTENYAISIKEYGAIADGARVKVINNRIYSGSDKAGGRGIFLANADGMQSFHPDSCIYIAGNTIDVHQGEDGAGDNCMGLIVRQGYNYVYIRDNIIRVTGDNNPGTSAYGQMLVPLRLTTAPTAGHLKVIGNTLISYFNGTAPTQNWYPTGTVIGSWGIMVDEADTAKTDWTIDSNTTEVQGVHIQLGWYNGPCGKTRFTNHTFGYYPSGGNSPNDATTWVTNQDYTPPSASYGSTYITHSLGSEIVDPLFIDGVDDTHIRWGSTASFPHASIKLSVTLAIRAVDSSGNPVQDATVLVTDAYGNATATGTTGPNGYYRPEVPYWYEENVAAGNNDSTAWNPYTVSVVTTSMATASSQLALDWNAKTLTLVAGTSTGEDRPITHIGGKVIFTGNVRIDNADVPDLNDPGGPVGD